MNKQNKLISSETGGVSTFILIFILIIVAVGIFFVWQNLSARPFTPVVLTETEKKELEKKMSALYNSAKNTLEKKSDEKEN